MTMVIIFLQLEDIKNCIINNTGFNQGCMSFMIEMLEKIIKDEIKHHVVIDAQSLVSTPSHQFSVLTLLLIKV
jgi:hypothetical protein